MVWIIVIAIFVIACILVSSSSKKQEKDLSGQAVEDDKFKKLESISMEEKENAGIYDKLSKIYYSGENYFECSSFTKAELKAIQAEIDNIGNEHDKEYIIAIRDEIMFSREPDFMSANAGNISMQPGEKCIFKTKNAILNTVQTVYRKINYNGFRYNIGLYRTGSMTFNEKDVEGFRRFDGGTIAITNQRLIFIGCNNKNKIISKRNILSYAPYGDNAVIIDIANDKPIVINFPCTGMFNITEAMPFFCDDKIHCLYALDKITAKEG